MFKPISPAHFFTKFTVECKRNESELVGRWRNSPAYTQFVREVLFRDVASALEIQYYGGEFWTLDGVMYCSKDSDNFRANTTYPHAICVALEHENVPGGSMVEMNKLQHFNASLKVLITYPNRQNSAESLLLRYALAIQQADVFQDCSTLRRQLVIFGSEHENYPVWTGYVYENGKFSEVDL